MSFVFERRPFAKKILFVIFLLFETATDLNEIGIAKMLHKKLNLNFIPGFEILNEDLVLSPCTSA